MKGAAVTVLQADSYPGQLATNHLAIHSHHSRHVYAPMTALFRFCTLLIGISLGGMLAAGAMLTPGKRIPRGELWAGRPAHFARGLTAEELDSMPQTIENYVDRAEQYLKDEISRMTE